MASLPRVDVNMIVYNSVATVGVAIESVLHQTWPAVSLTVIDNASTDGTFEVLQNYAASHPAIGIRRNRCNTGDGINIQRAFWFGDADYVMLKTGDDLIAPDYIEQLMGVLLAHPGCAMCHAAGLVFTGTDEVSYYYPPEHCLEATGPDPVERAKHVMWHYTSAPSFWGVYRRDAVDQRSMIRYRAGTDHSMLAELALYGEIRHVAAPLFWRRGGGKPVLQLARSSTEQGNRGVSTRRCAGRTTLAHAADHQRLRTYGDVRCGEVAVAAAPRADEGSAGDFPGPLAAGHAAGGSIAARCATRAARGARLSQTDGGSWLARTVTDALLGAQALLPEYGFARRVAGSRGCKW